MMTALERHRVYRLGVGDEAIDVVYIGREFPEDHPAVFTFQNIETGDTVDFLLDQLTALEKDGALRFGPKHFG